MTRPEDWAALQSLLREEAEIPGGELDWRGVLSLAESHRLLLPLRKALLNRGVSLPENLYRELEENRLAWAVKRRAYLGVLERVGEIAAAASIPALVFKGPVLAERLYGDPEERPFRDLDIMVDGSRLERFLKHLAQAEILVTPSPYSSIALDAIRRWELPLTLAPRRAPGLHIDLHLNPVHRFEPYHLPFPGFRPRSQPWAFGFHRPADEDLLLLLFVHAVKHGYFHLLSFYDLHRASLDPSVRDRFPQVLHRAREAGFGSAVLTAAEIGVRVLGSKWPELPPPTGRIRLAAAMIGRGLRTGSVFGSERPQLLLNAFLLVESPRRLARYLGLSLFRPPAAIPDRPYRAGGWANPWSGLVRAARRLRRAKGDTLGCVV